MLEHQLTTSELVKVITEQTDIQYMEVVAILNYGMRSSHFLCYDDGLIYDEGCDGDEFQCTPTEFLEEYKNYTWVVDEIFREDDDYAN